ncbi:MAG: SGNH/GDSL hydrolase family protein [Candidatus Hydrogenedentes bacterium]|nr:SGNH/GDSL hydrolase family protein [Candidatus Hydrogenedentota bacterium]
MSEQTTSKRRPRAWAKYVSVLPLVLAVFVAFLVAEILVRRGQENVALDDHLDPGMSRYDPTLGWTLVPRWTGEHRNTDFEVKYQINALGFRDDSPPPDRNPGNLLAVMGDSFTFGFGVNDGDTFVRHLNEVAPSLGAFVNFAVPGYSTDQEVLLLERSILKLRPRAVLLVVYLGNDIFDNELAYPIQVSLGKPRFILEGDALKLMNTPVPPMRKPASNSREDLRTAVLGEPSALSEFWSLFARHSVLLTRFQDRAADWRDHTGEFSQRYDSALALFAALIKRAEDGCEGAGCRLVMVVIGGRSTIEQPGSLSAQYQEFLRAAILDSAATNGIAVIDIATFLNAAARGGGQSFYFPNDGHLSPLGHAMVADILARELKPLLAE